MARPNDWQRVRSHRPYTIRTLATLLEKDPATVRRWINRHGLDIAIVSDTRPIILQGSKVKAWMKARQTARRKPCAPNQMFCVRCKESRQIVPNSFHIVQRNQSSLTLKGDCEVCQLTLQRFGSVAHRAALEAAFAQKPSDRQGASLAPNSIPHSPLKCPVGERSDRCSK